MPLLESAFQPAWWLRGSHAQTVWPALFRQRRQLAMRWQKLELSLEGSHARRVWLDGEPLASGGKSDDEKPEE